MQVEKREVIKPRKLEIEKSVLEISMRILRLKCVSYGCCNKFSISKKITTQVYCLKIFNIYLFMHREKKFGIVQIYSPKLQSYCKVFGTCSYKIGELLGFFFSFHAPFLLFPTMFKNICSITSILQMIKKTLIGLEMCLSHTELTNPNLHNCFPFILSQICET